MGIIMDHLEDKFFQTNKPNIKTDTSIQKSSMSTQKHISLHLKIFFEIKIKTKGTTQLIKI